ncbi:MAG: ester cyclase [Chloroflexota bacterium]
MSEKTDLVLAYLDAINAGDVEKAGDYLTDDFEFIGPMPEPMGKEAYNRLRKINSVAFPDWKFTHSDILEEGDVVKLSFGMSGTHTGVLDMSAMGMQVWEPTNNSFDIPPVTSEWTVVDGKIISLRTDPNPDAGFSGIKNQLGL